jgi:membrane-bound lytic murein transglycosylase B
MFFRAFFYPTMAYFSRHGWQLGNSIVHQVAVKNTSIVRKENTLKPYAMISQLESQGVTFDEKAKSQSLDKKQMATLLHLKGKSGDEYWLGLNNFYVITRYNHSTLYAMAVYQLSEKLKK